jgi:hypothetical protein
MSDAQPDLPVVSPEAQELMTACKGAMSIISCVSTESAAHDLANATFEEAASQLDSVGGARLHARNKLWRCSLFTRIGRGRL